MPLLQQKPSPYKVGQVDETWSYCDGFSYSLSEKRLTLAYLTYADKASAYSEGQPQSRVEIQVAGEEFDALIAQHSHLFAGVQAAVDAYALTRPEFAGGQLEAP